MSSIEKQIEWEHEQVERGIRRYRASLTKDREDGGVERKSLAETEPGRVIASELIGPLVARIEQEQLALADPSRNATGRMKYSDDQWVLLAMDAEVLAATTVLQALSRTEDAPWASAAARLGTAVKHEYDYRRWKDAEARAEKDRKDSDAAWAPNLYKLMKARNKVIDQRVFMKWSKKSPHFTGSTWSYQTRVKVGSTLFTYLVESNGWFEVALVREGIRTVRYLRLTELAQRFIADRHKQNELMRPYLLPMICEPLDYAYVETDQ